MRTLALWMAGSALLGMGPASPQQTSEDQTRQIVAEEFLNARPAPAKATANPRPRYRPADPSGKTSLAEGGVELGLTLWRLRPSQESQEGARLLVQDAPSGSLTAERIDTGAPLAVGDRVRLTIESPAAGWLYVIDREAYADGTMSDPYLIFPTARTRRGDNSVRAGRLVDIPDQQDRPNYFTVKPSRPGQSGELLTILVISTPLANLTIGDQPLKLPTDLVESWQKSWTVPVQQFVQEDKNRIWTRQEQTAASDRARLLTQDDPAPQTIFRVAVKKGEPVFVNVKLPYAASDRPK